MARLWVDPERRAYICADEGQVDAPPTGSSPGASTATNAPAAGSPLVSGRFVSRTKLGMCEESGLRPDLLDGLVAGRIQTSQGWRLTPRSLLGESPRRIFPCCARA